jgi:hypothetical protein
MNRKLALFLTLVLLVIAAIPVLADGVKPEWHQGFESDTSGWIDGSIAGRAGWCGIITRYDRGSGPVAPSVGSGYALVENGDCNEFWQTNPDNTWIVSGPFAPFGGFSESWPQSGFVTELDIYLDPGWDEDTIFDYYVSMNLLDTPGDAGFRYFRFPVEKNGEALLVVGHEVSVADWYTFRVRFREESGQLAVDFELARDGRVVYAQPMTTTAFYGAATSSFEVSNIGTGYSWFDSISDGLQLPIDQHKYRPGK